jgi:imidazolonepropionase-like amidohydrolase
VEHGLSARAALAAATWGGAVALGIETAVGAIRPGLAADLVVVDGDPLTDVAMLGRPERLRLVLHNGVRVAAERPVA